MSEPLITIGISNYNGADMIGRAFNSAVKQDWPNVEIIIVDDCSSDNSVEIINGLINDVPNARLIVHQVNKGVSGARNTVLKNAKGDFIAVFDGDDESLQNRLSAQYERLVSYEKESGTQNVVCYGSGIRRYDSGYDKKLTAIGSQPVEPKGKEVPAYLLFFERQPGVFYAGGTPTCSMFIRKKVLQDAGGFDETFRRVEDAELAIRLGLQGAHFIGCTEDVFIQYATVGSHKSADKNLYAELNLAEKFKEYLISTGRYDYARLWPYLRYYHFTGNYGMLVVTLMRLFVRYPVLVTKHFLSTAPKRLLHEMKMNKRVKP